MCINPEVVYGLEWALAFSALFFCICIAATTAIIMCNK